MKKLLRSVGAASVILAGVHAGLAAQWIAADARHGTQVELKDLGTVFEGSHARAAAINQRGEAVGLAIGGVLGTRFTRPVLWGRDGRAQLFLGETAGNAFDINDRGDVVGVAFFGLVVRAFLWSPEDGVRFLPDGFLPIAINNHRHVLGRCGRFFAEACVWVNEQLIPLMLPFRPTAINNRGHIAGFTGGGGGEPSHTALWTPKEGLVVIEPAEPSEASGMNDRDVLVGALGPPFPLLPYQLPAIWERGEMRTLERPGQAVAVNNRGWVVGYFFSLSSVPLRFVPFVWLPTGQVIDLPTLGGASSVVADINDRGEAVGMSHDAQGFEHAVMWTIDHGKDRD